MMPYAAKLICHSATESHFVQGIEARVRWKCGGVLALTYLIKGDIGRLRIPPPRPQRRTDRLWQHTCFEAFVSAKGSSAYQEFNFSPSGEWAAYAFHGYRERAPLKDDELAPQIGMRSASDTLKLQAMIPVDHLPTIPPGTWLRLGLSAVVEEEPGMLTYWALKHPEGKPDFHHPVAFALEVEPLTVKAVRQLSMDKR
jgi:hypothetical protein